MKKDHEEVKIGKIIKKLRTDRNICQKEVAAYLHTSIGTVSGYENDVHAPDLGTLCRLAEFYGVSVDYILQRTKYPYVVDNLYRNVWEGFRQMDYVSYMLWLSPHNRESLVDLVSLVKCGNEVRR